MQLNILNKLEKAINKEGTLIEKEYVKGRKNLTANPAIGEYNKTVTAANNTVTTLMKIVNNIKDEEGDESAELIAFIQGRK